MAKHTISIDPVTIKAPAEVVWQILTDLPKYPEWNPFSVKAKSSLIIGEAVNLYIARGTSGKTMKQEFVLEVFDAPNKIAWRLPKMGHKILFNAYREQTITAIDEGTCTYTTSDTFAGLIAGKIYKAQGHWVKENFLKMADALKVRAEEYAKTAE